MNTMHNTAYTLENRFHNHSELLIRKTTTTIVRYDTPIVRINQMLALLHWAILNRKHVIDLQPERLRANIG